MALKVRSRREKVGSGLGLLLGIIGFNLLVPFFFEKQAGFDGNQMFWAAVTALLCAELGAIPYVGLKNRRLALSEVKPNVYRDNRSLILMS
ncbi:hypothetical protein AB2J22_11510 [Aeromonas sp. A5]|uniref:hypothetical protein n=1 Tax=unclassified Aeromonas TaxID=257493 RepID=UPI00376FAFBF